MTPPNRYMRRHFTDVERNIFAALSGLSWRDGSLDQAFVRTLSRHDTITAREAKRMVKLALTHAANLPIEVTEQARALSALA